MGCSTILDMAPPNPSRSLVTNSAYPTICPVNEPFPVDYHSNRNKGSCNKKARGQSLASSTVPSHRICRMTITPVPAHPKA